MSFPQLPQTDRTCVPPSRGAILHPTGNARLFRAHIQGQFMDKLIIEGGVPLTGVVHVSGSKNAALPILMGFIVME